MKTYSNLTFLYIAAFFSTSCLNELPPADAHHPAPKDQPLQGLLEIPRLHRLTPIDTFALIDPTPSLTVIENLYLPKRFLPIDGKTVTFLSDGRHVLLSEKTTNAQLYDLTDLSKNVPLQASIDQVVAAGISNNKLWVLEAKGQLWWFHSQSGNLISKTNLAPFAKQELLISQAVPLPNKTGVILINKNQLQLWDIENTVLVQNIFQLPAAEQV